MKLTYLKRRKIDTRSNLHCVASYFFMKTNSVTNKTNKRYLLDLLKSLTRKVALSKTLFPTQNRYNWDLSHMAIKSKVDRTEGMRIARRFHPEY